MADDAKTPFHNPFGALSHLRGDTPIAPAPPRPPDPSPAGSARTIARAVVRLERAGRGGKDVTVIEQLGLSGSERDLWLKALKSALGCGGVVEGEALVMQGDHRRRLPPLLAARGVKKVTVG